MLSGKCLESKSIETNELEWFITKKRSWVKTLTVQNIGQNGTAITYSINKNLLMYTDNASW